jgi:hypothetical protein
MSKKETFWFAVVCVIVCTAATVLISDWKKRGIGPFEKAVRTNVVEMGKGAEVSAPTPGTILGRASLEVIEKDDGGERMFGIRVSGENHVPFGTYIHTTVKDYKVIDGVLWVVLSEDGAQMSFQVHSKGLAVVKYVAKAKIEVQEIVVGE